MNRPHDTRSVARWLLVAACAAGVAAACSSGEGDTQPGPEPDLEPFVPGDCLPGELLLDDDTCLPAGLPPPPPCEAGSVEASPPGDCCAAGTVPLDDGSCEAAGVPPDDCGAGFEADDEGACVAVMPASPCGLGEMALPGETTCRPVAPCGAAPWGDIPVDSTTQYVDGAYGGGNSDGSEAAPWTTIADGITAAAPGAIVAVAAGTYAEGLVVAGRPVRIWGRCPGLVTIEPPGDGVRIGQGADGTAIHTLTIRGGGVGVDNAGAADVVVDRLVVANATDHAIRVRGDDHATNEASLTVTGSLIEAGHRAAILAAGSDLTVEDTVVHRGNDSSITGGEGIRVEAYGFAGNPQVPDATIRRVVVERTYRLGILFSGASGVIEDTLVRDTLPTEGVGRGLAIEAHPDVLSRSDVVLRRSVIEGAHELGVLVSGSTAELEHSVVRATQPSPATNESAGIHVQPQGTERSRLTVRHSSVLETAGIGIAAFSADLELTGALLRDVSYARLAMEGTAVMLAVSSRTLESSEATILGSRLERHSADGLMIRSAEVDLAATVIGDDVQGATEPGGAGIVMVADETLGFAPVLTVSGSLVRDNRGAGVHTGAGSAVIAQSRIERTGEASDGFGYGVSASGASEVIVQGSVIEDNASAGVLVAGATAHVDGTAIRTSPGTGTNGAVGLRALDPFGGGAQSVLTMRSSLVEGTTGYGVELRAAEAVLEATEIRQVAAFADGLFGDGVLAARGVLGTTVALRGCRIADAARASLANFGAHAIVQTTAFECAPVHLNGEVFNDVPYSFENEGGNSCGCGEDRQGCKVLSSSLEPPGPMTGEHLGVGDPSPDTFDEIGPAEP